MVERATHSLVGLLSRLRQSRGDELFIVEFAATIDVDGSHDGFELLHRRAGRLELQALTKFVEGDGTGVVGVKALEQFLQTGDLVRGHGARHGHQTHLLELGDAGEFLEALEDDVVELRLRRDVRISHPWVLQNLGRRQTLLWVRVEHGSDELLGFRTDFRPRSTIEIEGAL